jgi:hypothetical protein
MYRICIACAALTGLEFFVLPHFPRALPWADLFWPFRPFRAEHEHMPSLVPPGQGLRFRHIFSVSIFYLELHKVWSWLGL